MAPLSLSDIGHVTRAICGQLTEQLPVKNREQLHYTTNNLKETGKRAFPDIFLSCKKDRIRVPDRARLLDI